MRQLSPEAIGVATRVLAVEDECTATVDRARILPPEAYTSDAFYAFEGRAIFDREWLAVAHANEIPNPGDHLALTVLGEPLVVVRGVHGEVRALSAICQHRGHPIYGGLGAPEGEGCRRAARLTCPYHNWVYNLDGTLAAAPAMNETTPLASLRSTIRLPEVRSEIFHGVVFVNFDPTAPPLAPSLWKLDRELATFSMDRLLPMPATMRRDLPWNWKIHHENALEPYHTDYVHRGAHEAAPARLAEFVDFEPGDGQVMHPTYLVSADADLGTNRKAGRFATIDSLTDEQRRRVMFASVPPLLFGIFQPTFVSLSFLLPKGPGVLDLRRVNLYPRAAVEADGFGPHYEEQLERKALAIHQDEVTMAALQQAYAGSRYVPRGTLSKLEETIPQMNRWLFERYRSSLRNLETLSV